MVFGVVLMVVFGVGLGGLTRVVIRLFVVFCLVGCWFVLISRFSAVDILLGFTDLWVGILIACFRCLLWLIGFFGGVFVGSCFGFRGWDFGVGLFIGLDCCFVPSFLFVVCYIVFMIL